MNFPNIPDVMLDALLDSLRVLPFLFAAYLLIEYLERKKSASVENWLKAGGKWGFVPGALLGLLPQCGFAAMAADFYACGVVSLGTLMAVFMATSDEALPLMIANPESYPYMLLLLAVKLVYALLVGLVLDVLLRRFIPVRLRGGYVPGNSAVACHHHEEEDGILLAAVKHTAGIFFTVLVFNAMFGFLVAWLGYDNVAAFLSRLGPFQPAVAGAFGLIPNCAATVTLTQLFLSGSIRFSSLLAGLCTNAGIGLTVLFRANKSVRQNLFILLLLYILGTLPGQVLYLLGV